MIERESVEIPARTERRTKAVICDLCGKSAKKGWWGQTCFDVEDIEISHTSGTRYPEGGITTKVEFHVCPECFTDKVAPWMESQGAVPTESESDW